MPFRKSCTYGETALSNLSSAGETHTRRTTSEAATPEYLCYIGAGGTLSLARNQ